MSLGQIKVLQGPAASGESISRSLQFPVAAAAFLGWWRRQSNLRLEVTLHFTLSLCLSLLRRPVIAVRTHLCYSCRIIPLSQRRFFSITSHRQVPGTMTCYLWGTLFNQHHLATQNWPPDDLAVRNPRPVESESAF